MSELKMTFNQIKNEINKEFEHGYDNPEDMSGCTDAANQEFHCCGDDCPNCSGNNECRRSATCTCTATNDPSNACTMNCPNDNLESCTIEHRWEMTEHLPPQTITDETGTNNQYIKIVRITKTYRSVN